MDNEFIISKMQELSYLIDYESSNISISKDAMHCQIIHKPGDGENRKNYTNDNYATLGDALLKLILTEYFLIKVLTRLKSLKGNNL